MAWETRGNNSYFYRKERRGANVKSEYIGHGEVAELIDQFENVCRATKEIEKRKRKREMEKDEIIDEKLNAISKINQSLVDALFLINGFHQHKRQWRKKRK